MQDAANANSFISLLVLCSTTYREFVSTSSVLAYIQPQRHRVFPLARVKDNNISQS